MKCSWDLAEHERVFFHWQLVCFKLLLLNRSQVIALKPLSLRSVLKPTEQTHGGKPSVTFLRYNTQCSCHESHGIQFWGFLRSQNLMTHPWNASFGTDHQFLWFQFHKMSKSIISEHSCYDIFLVVSNYMYYFVEHFDRPYLHEARQ